MIIGPNDDPSWSTSFSYSTFDKLRRLAIRAAEFGPEADYWFWTVIEIHNDGISVVEKNEGPASPTPESYG